MTDKPTPPGKKRIPVRFVDVCFGNGVPDQSLTLFPKDELTISAATITVQFQEKSQEIVVMYIGRVAWFSVRDGEVFVPEDKT